MSLKSKKVSTFKHSSQAARERIRCSPVELLARRWAHPRVHRLTGEFPSVVSQRFNIESIASTSHSRQPLPMKWRLYNLALRPPLVTFAKEQPFPITIRRTRAERISLR